MQDWEKDVPIGVMLSMIRVLFLLFSVVMQFFNLEASSAAGQQRTASFRNEHGFGTLVIQSPFPSDQVVTLQLTSPSIAAFSVKLISTDKEIYWKSDPLPVGPYEVSYELPVGFTPVPSQHFDVRAGAQTVLSPTLFTKGTIHVIANIPDATFELRSLNHTQVWRGEGATYDFREIPPGTYRLSFSTQRPEKYMPPKEMYVTLDAMDNQVLKVHFHTRPPSQATTTVVPTPSISVPVLSKDGLGQLSVSSNISSGGFSLYKVSGSHRELVGHYTGKNVQLPLSPKNRYELVFDDVPNYKAPEQMVLSPNAAEKLAVQISYSPQQAFISIPAGKAIIGSSSPIDTANELPAKIVNLSAFSIGTYEVTNAQYADWLNKALKDSKIVYVSEADQRGQVLDMQGRLIFKTFEADIYSQILVELRSEGGVFFTPLAGKDNYPVIDVSWQGAVAYCQDNQCRLPTEAEWEKAAGMEPEVSGMPLKKFIYGFGRDQIDPTFANYKVSDSPLDSFQVATTPVGFYNGVNLLSLNIQHKDQQKTHLAKSPYGAFDMSGNVWEWVADWFDPGYIANMSDTDPQGPASGLSKVVKGGCYDSLADGVRVTERLGLPLDYADAYTGFRIAK